LDHDFPGGKKSGFYHDDLWTIKYLKGFKWTHLTEQIGKFIFCWSWALNSFVRRRLYQYRYQNWPLVSVCLFSFSAYEKAVREQRIRNEMTLAKKEDEFYLDQVKQGLAIEAMQKKRKVWKRPIEIQILQD
jgi:hypothetical protein